ncbi:MAG: hypothetical protein KF774_05955 [Planctomyces sp.]|nr:hypothetical protein [Planctomyces sp.]
MRSRRAARIGMADPQIVALAAMALRGGRRGAKALRIGLCRTETSDGTVRRVAARTAYGDRMALADRGMPRTISPAVCGSVDPISATAGTMDCRASVAGRALVVRTAAPARGQDRVLGRVGRTSRIASVLAKAAAG